MAIPTANFLSYNSTGMNTVKSEWIRNLCDVTKTGFCTIQEHFKKINSDKFFKEHFNAFIFGHIDLQVFISALFIFAFTWQFNLFRGA